MTDPDMFDPLPPPSANGHAPGNGSGRSDHWRPIMPVPDDTPISFPRTRLGQPSTVWEYREKNKLLHCICRWDLGNGEKTVKPLCYCENETGVRAWRWMAPPPPRPLYGLDHLAQAPTAPVLVVEGEKAADAARALFRDHVGITSSGGSEAAAAADWLPLGGRDVAIWPDHDPAGQRYAGRVASLARAAGATSIRVVVVRADWAKGWDLADERPDGVDEATLRRMLEEAQELEPGSLLKTIDLDLAGLKSRDGLLAICDGAMFWQSADQEAFATIPVGDHVEHLAVRSREFAQWLLHGLAHRYTQRGRPASATDSIVRDVRAHAEAQARYAGKTHRVVHRILEHEETVFIDRGTADWSAIAVTQTGRSVVPQAPTPILRSKRVAPFPEPSQRGSLGPLRRLLRHLDRDTFILLVGWCLGALLPRGPYPILVLVGEQGSGKSVLARLVQRLVDPINGDLLQPPGNTRDLVAAAKLNRVLMFDNLSSVSPELADGLCRLATGGEIGGRALFTDHDSASFTACRPIVLNGIPDLATRGDLADRAIMLRLPVLTKGRMTERDWTGTVETASSPTFAMLLDALSCGLRNLASTPTCPDIRMADFARFVAAAEPCLPWRAGSFLAAYRQSRRETTVGLAVGDPVQTAVQTFMTQRPQWDGLVSELFTELTRLGTSNGKPPSGWPGNARWFSESLRRSTPTLRAFGIDCRERRGNAGKIVRLSRTATLAAPASPPGADREDGRVASVASVAKNPNSPVTEGDHSTGKQPNASAPTEQSPSSLDYDNEIIEGRT